MKKFRVITKIGDRIVKASSVYYDDVFITFKNEAKETVATFMVDQVIGILNEND